MALIMLNSCTKKAGIPIPKPCETSYATDIVPIINSKCSITGCHTSGVLFGDYTNYAELKARADNGKIKLLVLDNATMPIGSSLTGEQMQKIKCWLDNGAQNN